MTFPAKSVREKKGSFIFTALASLWKEWLPSSGKGHTGKRTFLPIYVNLRINSLIHSRKLENISLQSIDLATLRKNISRLSIKFSLRNKNLNSKEKKQKIFGIGSITSKALQNKHYCLILMRKHSKISLKMWIN